MTKYIKEFKYSMVKKWCRLDKILKKIEQELRSKEDALAETAALLVLKKKANAIWGDGEDAWSAPQIALCLLNWSTKQAWQVPRVKLWRRQSHEGASLLKKLIILF